MQNPQVSQASAHNPWSLVEDRKMIVTIHRVVNEIYICRYIYIFYISIYFKVSSSEYSCNKGGMYRLQWTYSGFLPSLSILRYKISNLHCYWKTTFRFSILVMSNMQTSLLWTRNNVVSFLPSLSCRHIIIYDLYLYFIFFY